MKTVCFLGLDAAGKTVTIPVVAKKLEGRGKTVACMSSTAAIPDIPMTAYLRNQLVSPSTTNFQRFNAALRLLKFNMQRFRDSLDPDIGLPDFLLCDRSGSDLVAYNPLPDIEAQASHIPAFDFAFYFYAEFDTLTARLRSRGGTDFQDTDFKFRERMQVDGPKYFTQLNRSAGFIVDTTSQSIEDSAEAVVRCLLET